MDAGARRIEAVSFAHPRVVPAMSDAEDVMARVPRDRGVSWAGLVLNRRGLDRAIATGVDEVNVVVCVSDTFSHRNQNASTDDAMRMAEHVAAAADAHGLLTTLTLATAFGCPFEGEIAVDRVIELVRRGAQAGFDEICLADTIGVGTPDQVRTLTTGAREVVGDAPLRFHFHNTRNTGFVNAYAAILEGITVLDASAGGIGGCPFAPRATGNIATDDLVYALERMGLPTGLSLESLIATSAFLAGQLGREPPALVARAGPFP